jgi:hypothetical protein
MVEPGPLAVLLSPSRTEDTGGFCRDGVVLSGDATPVTGVFLTGTDHEVVKTGSCGNPNQIEKGMGVFVATNDEIAQSVHQLQIYAGEQQNTAVAHHPIEQGIGRTVTDLKIGRIQPQGGYHPRIVTDVGGNIEGLICLAA